jgi:hypothetical protein
MRRKMALITGLATALFMFPLGSLAHACPDPDNPCDPQPYTLKDIICWAHPSC